MNFTTAHAAAKDQERHGLGPEWRLEEPTQLREGPCHDSPVLYGWRARNDRLVITGNGPGDYSVQFMLMGAEYNARGATVAEAFGRLCGILLGTRAQLNGGLKEMDRLLPALKGVGER